MKKIITAIIATTGLLFFIFSCSNPESEKEKLLMRKWTYQEFRMNNDTMNGEQMGNPVMEFLPEGKYKVEIGGILEEGKWEIKGDDLITTNKPIKNKTEETNRLKIHELTSERLVLFSDEGGNKAYVTLVPHSPN